MSFITQRKKSNRTKFYLPKFVTILLPIILSLTSLVLVILNVKPPVSLYSASAGQLILSSLPLFLFLVFLTNLFFKNFLKSFTLSFFLIATLLLKGLGVINLLFLILITLSLLILSILIEKKYQKGFKKPIPKLEKFSSQKSDSLTSKIRKLKI